MKRNVFLSTLLSLCLVFAVILPGCGDDDDDNGTTPSVLYDVTGTWEVGAPGLVLVLQLTQNADGTITGTAVRTGDTVALTGTNINNNITLSIVFAPDDFINMTGIVEDENNMSGTLTTQTTVGYTDPWTATRSS